MTLPPWVKSEWDRLTCLTALYVATGFVAEEQAQSLLWIGLPGSGKSTLVRRFRTVSSVKEVLDLTADPLRKEIIPDVHSRGLRHLIFPEFHKCFQRKADTVENMVGVLTAAMSGELANSYVGQEHMHFPDVQFGLIGAMTPDVYNTWSRSLVSKGVQDRVVAMEFVLPQRERIAIEQTILSGRFSQQIMPVWWSWPSLPVKVSYAPDSAFLEALTQWLDEVRRKGNRNRLANQVRVLLKASAVMQGRTKVTVADLDVLYALQPYFKEAK